MWNITYWFWGEFCQKVSIKLECIAFHILQLGTITAIPHIYPKNEVVGGEIGIFFQNIGILFCTFHQKLWITLSGKILYFMIFDPPGSIHYLKYYIQNLTWGLDTSKVSCADAIKYCFPMVAIFIWYLTMEKPYMEAICFIFFFFF